MQKEYYVFQQDYYKLKTLRDLIKANNPDNCKACIEHMKTHKLDTNAYIELSDGIFVPIIYYAALSVHYTQFIGWLVKNGANVNRAPDIQENITTTFIGNILFTCAEKYCSFFINNGAKCSAAAINSGILHKLEHGNLRRIKILQQLAVITANDIRAAVRKSPLLIGKCINRMLERIKFVCLTVNTASAANKIRAKYADIITLILRYSDTLTSTQLEELYKQCASFYLHDIIAVLLRQSRSSVSVSVPPVYYHEDLDQVTVATLRQLFNDENYAKTCTTLSLPIDPRAY